jgi:hypothetical protein
MTVTTRRAALQATTLSTVDPATNDSPAASAHTRSTVKRETI